MYVCMYVCVCACVCVCLRARVEGVLSGGVVCGVCGVCVCVGG